MFGSTTLDIALGITFMYLLLSLVVTAIQEVIDALIKLRAAHLAKGIEKLLGGPMAKNFFANPLIKAFSPNQWFGQGTRKPSYIPSRAFAVTVLDLLAQAKISDVRTIEDVRTGISKLPDGDLKRSLTLLLDESEQRLDAFERALEGWFNGQMERVTGWYKRKVQLIVMAIALLITVGLNADSLAIVKRLSNDSALRASLVTLAQEEAKQPLATGGQSRSPQGQTAEELTRELDTRVTAVQDSLNKVQGLGVAIGFGWRSKDFDWSTAIPGWLLTAFAISLGAPFWFDMLNKVISIRSAGKAPDEKAKR